MTPNPETNRELIKRNAQHIEAIIDGLADIKEKLKLLLVAQTGDIRRG